MSDSSRESSDEHWMSVALEAAARGEGLVEPNPMVGCVLVRNNQQVGLGFHQKFGGEHAEIVALNDATASGVDSFEHVTAYVSLEPCCHAGKTPPCTDALIQSGIGRVVIAMTDPFPKVDGGGIKILKESGIQIQTGILEQQATDLNRAYLKRVNKGQPWVIGKWAMTLDGKIASSSGDSQWISNEVSRSIVHDLRRKMDAIIIGSGTALADNPRLTARPGGSRIATRVVLDSRLRIESASQLVKTASETPTLIVTGTGSDKQKKLALQESGCEILELDSVNENSVNENSVTENSANENPIEKLLCELGRRQFTNVLVEGGGQLLGSFVDANAIDEVHVFLANKIVGGAHASTPVGGIGKALIADAFTLVERHVEILNDDVYLHGIIDRRTGQ